jgi:glycosyltransferase involved in cell wall biosynthesis
VVVPLYNEEDNVDPLLERIHLALGPYPYPWEVVIVDDGSSDNTVPNLEKAALRYGPHVRIVALMRNFKQTAAMQAGLDAARGDVIVTMDGDLQNDPIDIPRMVGRLLREDLDLVAGWRKNRKDGMILRKIPSKIANRLIARITGVHLQDYGCSLKAFRASAIKNVRLYGEMHRFIPAWLATVTTPRKIAQEEVTHHARMFGESKYGISRTFRVILDLIFVYFFMRFRTRPGHFFGGIGLALGALGILILTYLGRPQDLHRRLHRHPADVLRRLLLRDRRRADGDHRRAGRTPHPRVLRIRPEPGLRGPRPCGAGPTARAGVHQRQKRKLSGSAHARISIHRRRGSPAASSAA